jgi:hypothetical protein
MRSTRRRFLISLPNGGGEHEAFIYTLDYDGEKLTLA